MFTKILYINLDRRTDRKEHVLDGIKKIGYSGKVERVAGVDWKTIDFNNIDSKLFTENAVNTALDKTKPLYSPMTKGGIGCALAHRNAYLNVLNSNDEYVLIVEDDIWFDEQFMDKLNKYLKEIPKYDILWLGYHYKDIKEETNKCYNIPGRYLFGLFGYVINKKAARELLTIFPLEHQIDSEIPKIFSKLKVYSIKEDLKLIHSMPSSTETQFGTDIQIREDFSNTDTSNYIIFLIILLLLIFLYKGVLL